MTPSLNINVLFMMLISRRKNKKIVFQTWRKKTEHTYMFKKGIL